MCDVTVPPEYWMEGGGSTFLYVKYSEEYLPSEANYMAHIPNRPFQGVVVVGKFAPKFVDGLQKTAHKQLADTMGISVAWTVGGSLQSHDGKLKVGFNSSTSNEEMTKAMKNSAERHASGSPSALPVSKEWIDKVSRGAQGNDLKAVIDALQRKSYMHVQDWVEIFKRERSNMSSEEKDWAWVWEYMDFVTIKSKAHGNYLTMADYESGFFEGLFGWQPPYMMKGKNKQRRSEFKIIRSMETSLVRLVCQQTVTAVKLMPGGAVSPTVNGLDTEYTHFELITHDDDSVSFKETKTGWCLGIWDGNDANVVGFNGIGHQEKFILEAEDWNT